MYGEFLSRKFYLLFKLSSFWTRFPIFQTFHFLPHFHFHRLQIITKFFNQVWLDAFSNAPQITTLLITSNRAKKYISNIVKFTLWKLGYEKHATEFWKPSSWCYWIIETTVLNHGPHLTGHISEEMPMVVHCVRSDIWNSNQWSNIFSCHVTHLFYFMLPTSYTEHHSAVPGLEVLN